MNHVKYIDVIFKKYQKWIFEIKIAEKVSCRSKTTNKQSLQVKFSPLFSNESNNIQFG